MTSRPTFSAAQLDRAGGALVGCAAGDALGAPYEFGPPLPADHPVGMVGGGLLGWAPGEWTDDTAMAIAIAEVTVDGLDLRTIEAQDRIVRRWAAWADGAKDVGIQTGAVLSDVGRGGAVQARQSAARHHEQRGRSGGNGSLMRTAPVALAYLDDEQALIEAATAISSLTHFDHEAGEACVLWCLAIRHAVLTGSLDVRVGLGRLDDDRRAVWSQRIDGAETSRPSDFTNNGWVVEALQAAWSAISMTRAPVDDPAQMTSCADHLRLSLEAAARGGNDTDTVAAIAGALVGATYGAAALPEEWRRVLHGWPGLRAGDLDELASAIVRREPPTAPGPGPL